MKNTAMQERLGDEILSFIDSRKSLMLSSINEEGEPYASYAPFAVTEENDGFYVLLSTIAVHAKNLLANSKASVLIIEDEDSARELFARLRCNYSVNAEYIKHGTDAFEKAVKVLENRHGERSRQLSELSDFHMFKLTPKGGRYVTGFGRAYMLAGDSLTAESINHLRDGHMKRDTKEAVTA